MIIMRSEDLGCKVENIVDFKENKDEYTNT